MSILVPIFDGIGPTRMVVGEDAADFGVELEVGKIYVYTATVASYVRQGRSVAVVASVNPTADTFTFAAPHAWLTGHGPTRLTNSGGALPGGTDNATNYWTIRVSDTELALASSKANAEAGTRVPLSSAGTGTHSLLDDAGPSQGSLYLPAGQSMPIVGSVYGRRLSAVRLGDEDGEATLTAATVYPG